MQEGDKYNGQELERGFTFKTNGDCEEIIVRDYDYYNEDGLKKKVRFKPTNITPKKKRNKKR